MIEAVKQLADMSCLLLTIELYSTLILPSNKICQQATNFLGNKLCSNYVTLISMHIFYIFLSLKTSCLILINLKIIPPNESIGTVYIVCSCTMTGSNIFIKAGIEVERIVGLCIGIHIVTSTYRLWLAWLPQSGCKVALWLHCRASLCQSRSLTLGWQGLMQPH